MEYVSAGLSKDEILEYLMALPSLLSGLGLTECKVMYGWQCDLPAGDLWEFQRVPIVELSAFVVSSMVRGVFTPGASDLIINSPDDSLSIKACHESDIHLSGFGSALAMLAAPIAAQHPEFNFKLDGSWQVRRFSGLA